MHDIEVTASVDERPDGNTAYYVAAAPPDFRSSFTGSGLPFKDQDQAFYNTPNRGRTAVRADGSFTVKLLMPNSFYDGSFATTVTPPTLFVFYNVGGDKRRKIIPIGNGVPFRSLTYPNKRLNASFYDVESPWVRSQEAILRASAYPCNNEEPSNFWGGRPAR